MLGRRALRASVNIYTHGYFKKPLTFSILLNIIEAEENMAKTITVRVDDNIYSIFKRAAEGQKRTISNYIEYATLNYTVNESFVDDEEIDRKSVV